jgi:poly-beta-1,6-N-acetyl-D-glucosamine synthase
MHLDTATHGAGVTVGTAPRDNVNPIAVVKAPSRVPLPQLPGLARPRRVRFMPEKLAPWLLCTFLVVAAAVVVGLLIPQGLEYVLRRLAGAGAGTEAPWFRPVLVVLYVSFVVLVIVPFVAFWAWGRLFGSCHPASDQSYLPKVSILIPAFNEQEMILDAVHGALGQNYPDFEVIVIDDGSTDLTPYLVSTQPVRLIRKSPNAGKAAALNTGLEMARGEVIVTCDGDGYLAPEAVRHLVCCFADPQVAGVAGQVRLFQPKSLLRWFQVMEYDANQGLLKQAMHATTGTVLVAPGPVSAFRADVLRALGGVPGTTLTEDFDLTLALVSHGYRVAYEPRAVAFTDAPQTDAELKSQRIRWSRGGIQVLWKHRRLFGNRAHGLVGFFWLPYLLLTGYLMIPLSLALLAALPLLASGSGAPFHFLVGVALYWCVITAFETGTVVLGATACNWRDLRYVFLVPVYCFYKNWRMRWFTVQALYREWRREAKLWNA